MNEPLACKYCGCTHVTWMKTNAGRWYLAAKYESVPGDAEARAYAHAARKRPHLHGRCPECNGPGAEYRATLWREATAFANAEREARLADEGVLWDP